MIVGLTLFHSMCWELKCWRNTGKGGLRALTDLPEAEGLSLESGDSGGVQLGTDDTHVLIQWVALSTVSLWDRQTDTQTDGQTDRQMDRQRQTDRPK